MSEFRSNDMQRLDNGHCFMHVCAVLIVEVEFFLVYDACVLYSVLLSDVMGVILYSYFYFYMDHASFVDLCVS